MKILERGAYFGEISFIFNCRRTSTVKSKLYSTLGVVDHNEMENLITEFPLFNVYLRNDIIRHYDDDLKLFLVAALKRIDYLANCSDDILV